MIDIMFIHVAELLLCLFVGILSMYSFINLVIYNLNVYMRVFCMLSFSISASWATIIVFNLIDDSWYTPNRLLDLVVTISIVQTLSLLVYSLVVIVGYIVNKKIINKMERHYENNDR